MTAHPSTSAPWWARWTRRASLAALALAAVVTGCATPDTPVRCRLHYGMDDAPEGRQLLWPPPPEVPRYLYTGTLVGEPNFRAPGAGPGALARLGRWLVGLDAQPQQPLVLQRPGALVGDDAGRLYVADTSRRAVFVFDEPAGALHLWEQAEGLQRWVSPAGLALAPGRVFVSDAELRAVFVLAHDGTPLARWGQGLLQRPTGLARDPATGRLYVADTLAHDIKVFDERGELLQVIGRRGTAAGEFNFPTHLALATGGLYVTDALNSRVQVIPLGNASAPARQLGERGLQLGNLVRPKGVGVDAEGNVYVVESYYDTLLVYSARGEFLLPIGGTGTATGRFYLPAGVWVDGRNRVHVADQFNGRVVTFQFLGGG